MKQRWIIHLALILLFTMFSTGITVLKGEDGGGESPQAVFDAAQAAGAQRDFSALARLVAPTERALLALGTDMAVGMFVEFYEGEKAAGLKKRYQDIQSKYGVKSKDEDKSEKLQITKDTSQAVIDAHMRKRAQKLYGHVDTFKYIPELMEIIIHMPEMADQAFFPREKLGDLKIESDRATGMAGDKNISFIREGGRWYLTADVMD